MFKRRNEKNRNIKKIFQWEDYLNWKKMSSNQKINLKRALLFPFLVYLVYGFLTSYSYALLLILGIYFILRLIKRNKLKK